MSKVLWEFATIKSGIYLFVGKHISFLKRRLSRLRI
jgi:hypothetical protein